MTQAQVADHIGVTATAVCLWERGHSEPTIANLQAFVDARGISMSMFWSAEPPSTVRPPAKPAAPRTRRRHAA